MIQPPEADASGEYVDGGIREPLCKHCGSNLHWVECWNCGGEGYHDDLHERDPLWYSPDDTEACETCDGEGGWHVCPICCPSGVEE